MAVGAARQGGQTPHDEVAMMVAGFVLITLFWLGAFYTTSWAHRCWGRCVPLSTKEHENERYWITRHYMGSWMALMVACMALPVVWVLHDKSDEMRFMHTDSVAFCRMDEFDDEVLVFWGGIVSLAGMIFTGYTIADFFTMFAHGYSSPDYIVHHILFITAGLIIRSHCMMPYNAAMLMSMEASTPFLNQLLLHRHRGSSYNTKLAVCGVMFFLLFVTMRIILNSYGAVYLILNRHYLMKIVPPWQGWFVIVSVVGGTLVQYFWLPPVIKAFGANLMPMVRRPAGERELMPPIEVHADYLT